ncbi:MAG TPA: ribonuclease III [Opitutaceae bacterium]|nr:ribonuclease III [Opitutaceae bacterium]
MPDSDSQLLERLQHRLVYSFRDVTVLACALTHPSYLQDHPEVAESNQRLEFLGDAVLQLVLTEALFQLFPGDREGPLSRRRAALTKGSFLAALAREIGLDALLRLSPGEEATGGRRRDAALEDACEALFGAIYLDGGLPVARRVILDLYGPLPDRLAVALGADNPKGRLQEIVHPRHGNAALRYEVVQVAGVDHAREYEVSVFINDQPAGTGRGSSKKLAEEAAAQAALDSLAEA